MLVKIMFFFFHQIDKVKLAAKKQVYELEIALSGSKEKKNQLISFVVT